MNGQTPHHFQLADYGQVLATRARGGEAATHLREIAGIDDRDIIVDFDRVDVLSPVFAQELLGALGDLVDRSEDGRIVIASNLNEDVADSLLLVLERRKRSLAYQHGDQVELLVEEPHLLETLRHAQQLGQFTVQRLSKELGLGNSAVSGRLAKLQAAGAVARERDPSAERGKRHVYRAATSGLVDSAR